MACAALAWFDPAVMADNSCATLNPARGTAWLPKAVCAQAVGSRSVKPMVVEQIIEKICWFAWW